MQSNSVRDASDFHLPFMAAAVLKAGTIGVGGAALAIVLSCFIFILGTGTAGSVARSATSAGFQVVQVLGGAK